jgi:5'-nucleotidase
VTLRILLTNDDGIHAPGLATLRAAVDGLGEITTIAPDRNRSAIARAITIDRPLRAQPVAFGEAWPGLACDGTPSDCVRLGLLGVYGPLPDLVVSGINGGANMGADVTYSGTVGAALEAALRGRPALAFSVESATPRWLGEAAPLVRALVEQVIARGLPRHSILNVNLPDRPLAEFAGIHAARLGGASCGDRVFVSDDGAGPAALAGAPTDDAFAGAAEYSVPCDHPTCGELVATDFDVVARGCVAVTPLRSDLLDAELLAELATWDLDLERLRA